MSRLGRKRRGQPLAVYALVILGWVGVRAVTWESPFPATLARAAADYAIPAAAELKGSAARAAPAAAAPTALEGHEDWRAAPPVLPTRPSWVEPATSQPTEDAPVAMEFSDTQVAAGHQLLFLAAMAQLPVPRSLAQAARAESSAPVVAPWMPDTKRREARRWSLDSWILLREGGAASRLTGPGPSYGASQEGAVIRYRLGELGGRPVSAYARFAKALSGARETDLAAGFTTRPFASLPLDVHGELRATRLDGRTEWRPAAFVTTGLHNDETQKLQLRGYAQAGYVGGNFATAFADGQLVADREMVRFDLGRSRQTVARLGAGAWAGAQKGAHRIDLGPSANLVVPVTQAPVRLSLDYRIRVEGNADPASGIALTLSTGF